MNRIQSDPEREIEALWWVCSEHLEFKVPEIYSAIGANIIGMFVFNNPSHLAEF